jgi:hypothetical protein
VLLRDQRASESEYDDRLTSLETLLADLDLDIYRVVKTASGRLCSLDPVRAGFPRQVWTHWRANQNDYLFLPREDRFLLEHGRALLVR